MHKRIAELALVVFFAAALIACGSSMSSQPSSSGAASVPVSLTIRDNPPTGVTVLTFEIQITGAALQPSNPNSQAVSMLTEPAEVELEHLQTESALLANVSVPAGTYNGITVTFATPEMTILNQTGVTLTVGSQSCPNLQVCEVSPKLNMATVAVQAPTPPFPITLSVNSPLALRMDFDVNASIQQSDLSITPSISVSQLSMSNSENIEEMHLVGRVTSIDQTGQKFTLQDGVNGTSSTIATDSNTEFDFENACAANNFSCLMVGQILDVEAKLMPDGSLLATEVELFEPVNEIALEGTVTAVDANSNSFQIVVVDEQALSQQDMPNVSIGVPLTVNVAPLATFAIDANGLTLPSGMNFASVSDMIIGQAVQVHPTSFAVTGTPPNVTITADKVQLEPSQVTATVTAINASASPQTFTLGSLPPLFTNAGISSIQVDVLSSTQFEDVSGIGGLSNGNLVSVGGLLFNTTTAPTLVAEKVVKR